MQLRETLQSGLKTLLEQHVPSAQLAAELLLMHVLGCDRGYLHSHFEIDIPSDAVDRYSRLVAERATGKPTQYITGHQEFWGLDLEVTPDVLIPRPETEHVVEAVVDLARHFKAKARAALRIADVGTGSGCIALALAWEFPRAEIYATDISRPALVVAARNEERVGMRGRVRLLEGNLLDPLFEAGLAGTLDFVVSNPPYVAKSELSMVQREVREFEPRIAWGGLERGEQVYARLFPQALDALKPGGYVVVEIGYNMCDRVSALLGETWTETEVRPDLAGIPRVVIARKADDAP
jgi:release factor glutamine methyltransferase